MDTRHALGAIGAVALLLLTSTGLRAAAGALPARSEPAPEPAPEAVSAPLPRAPEPLRMGLPAPASVDPATLNPAIVTELVLADLLYDGLTQLPPGESHPVGALAASWAVSADQLRWTFTLRADARFSDGSAVQAADVKATLERIAALGAGSLTGLRLDIVAGYREFAIDRTAGDLAGVTAPDDRTVAVALRAPYPALGHLFASPAFGVVPRARALAARAGGDPFAAGELVTSGSYSVVGRRVDGLSLAARDAGAPGVEVSFQDSERAYRGLRAGELDWAVAPLGRAAEPDADVSSYTPFHSALFYAFNLADPVFADARFRRAILKAVDREAIVAAVYGAGAQPLLGVVPEGVADYRPGACGAACAYDPAGARALLAEAFPGAAPPAIRIDHFEGGREAAVAEKLRAGLAEVGINAEVRSHTFAEYQRQAREGTLQLFRFGWVGGFAAPDAFIDANFLTGGVDNPGSFSSAGVDAAVAAARAKLSLPERYAAYRDAEAAILAEAPIVPIAQFQARATLSSRVHGYRARLDGTFDPASLTLG